MKKILFITYYYPPSNGAGVQRPLGLSINLSLYGIEPIVLTVDPREASYTGIDEDLLLEVPSHLRVIKTHTNEHYKYYKRFLKRGIPTAGFANESNPGIIQKIARFIRGNFYFPDPRKGWFNYAMEQAGQLIEQENIDTVFTTSPPQSTHLIGLALKKKYGIKWICDLTDPWTDIYYFKQLYHLPFALRINQRMELEVLENADHLITCSPSFKALFLKKSKKIQSSTFDVLYVGYNAENFKDPISSPPSNEFVITYTGTIADSYNPIAFFKALRRLSKHVSEKIKLRLVGLASQGIIALIQQNELETLTEFTGVVSHQHALNFLMNSTILLLIVPENENNEGIIPGKIFEYFASSKPIFSLANPKGDVAQLIAENNFGKSFAHSQEEEMYCYLVELMNAWRINPNLDLPKKDLTRFESKYQAKRLAEIMHP